MKSRVAPTPIGTVFVIGCPKVRSSQLRGRAGDLGIEHDVEVGLAEPGEIGRRRAERRDDVDVDAEAAEQPGDLGDVVAMAEAERGRAEQVAARAAPPRAARGVPPARRPASARTSW